MASGAALLRLPYKLTHEVDFVAAIREHATTTFNKSNDPESHPESLASDARKLHELRRGAVLLTAAGQGEDAGGLLKKMVLYHAQLVYMLTKFPVDLGAAFPWYPLFTAPSSTANATDDTSLPGNLPSQHAIEYTDLQYERCNLLMNVAAAYISMANKEDRSTLEGTKRAIGHFQAAAGTLTYLRETVLPLLSLSPNDPSPPSPDLSAPALSTLIYFSLGQAQECFFKQALLSNLKNGSIAKVAAKASEYYDSTLVSAKEAKGLNGAWPTWGFPAEWSNHITYKRYHFAAVAQYRKSCDDLAANRYGDELGRLHLAMKYVKAGLDTSKRGVNQSVVVDSKSLQVTLADLIKRAERDNSLIYLQAVTSESSLPAIVPASMVNASTPSEIANPIPRLSLGRDGLGMKPLFERTMPYAVHLAISVYESRKENLLKDDLQRHREDLDHAATSTLQSLNLPASIQALEVPLGLPPSLLRKAEELRRDGGTKRIRTMMQDASSVAMTDKKVLDDVAHLLAQEESENNQLVQHFGSRWTRPDSNQLNTALKDKIRKFSDTLEAAGQSDLVVRGKFAEREADLQLLEGDQAALEDAIPSTSRKQPSYDDITSQSSQTGLVRQLRRQLEDVEDLTAARRRIIEEARQAMNNDDIRSKVLETATEFSIRHPNEGIKTEIFEDLFEQELEKFTYFKDTMSGNERRQSGLLEEITKTNEAFLNSRKSDPITKQREQVLQRLDVALSKHQEILVNLSEALQFYQDFAKLLDQLRATVREWVHARRTEAQVMITNLNMEDMSIQQGRQTGVAAEAVQEDDNRPPPTPPPASTSQTSAQSANPGTPRTLRAQQPGQWQPGMPIKFG